MGLLSFLLWGLLAIILLILGYVLYIAYKLRGHGKYFQKYNVPYMGAGVSQFAKIMTGSVSLVEVEKDVYKEATENKAPLMGFSDMFASTGVYIKDLELIKNIYVKDFDHFVNRRPVATQQANFYFSKMLFSMESDQWKGIRAKLSPSFTTGKIKRMFEIFKRSSENMSGYVQNQMGSQPRDLDLTQIFPKYAMDVIASCAFGIDSKCWDVPLGKMSTFEAMGKDFQFSFKPSMLFKFIVMMVAPKVADKLGLEVFDATSQNYFVGTIKDVIKRRRQTGERMDDFLQLMLDAQQGLLKADDETNQVMHGSIDPHQEKDSSDAFNTNTKVTFDDEDIVANALLFILGGFDTTQSLLIFSLYALALEPDVQQKLYEEVSSQMESNGGKLTYEGVLQMPYMDLVLNETLRMYPPATRTERRCTKDYPVTGTSFVIEKETIVAIPIYSIHHDPQHFPDPEKFIPERFTPENKTTRSPYAFMPFGHGPRNCIGMRFALVEVKAVIAQLVYKFQFAPCSQTKIPMKFDTSANLKPKGGLWLNVTQR